MKIFIFSLLVLISAQYTSACAAEPIGSVDGFINGLLYQSNAKCTANRGLAAREYQKQGKLLDAYQEEQAAKMMCDCLPSHAKALQARLPESERAVRMPESAFSKKYMTEILNQCSAEQAQSLYAGACAERYAGLVPNSAKFCSCMDAFTRQLSGAQAAQLGVESSDYMPLAANATKRGEVIPAPPPLLKSMMDSQKACARP
jgi:hypothetical protein